MDPMGLWPLLHSGASRKEQLASLEASFCSLCLLCSAGTFPSLSPRGQEACVGLCLSLLSMASSYQPCPL